VRLSSVSPKNSAVFAQFALAEKSLLEDLLI